MSQQRVSPISPRGTQTKKNPPFSEEGQFVFCCNTPIFGRKPAGIGNKNKKNPKIGSEKRNKNDSQNIQTANGQL